MAVILFFQMILLLLHQSQFLCQRVKSVLKLGNFLMCQNEFHCFLILWIAFDRTFGQTIKWVAWVQFTFQLLSCTQISLFWRGVCGNVFHKRLPILLDFGVEQVLIRRHFHSLWSEIKLSVKLKRFVGRF